MVDVGSSSVRDRYATILRVAFAALVLCEVSGLAGASPSLIRGGLATVLGLPFFAPALLGSFAAQVLLRPLRAELLATVAVAAGLLWPMAAVLTAEPFGILSAVCGALGVASLAVLGFRSFLLSGDERSQLLDVLLPALILPAFVILAHPMGYLTAALWPTTYDHRLYLADVAFGAPLSFVIGRWGAAVPLLPALLLVVYVALPLALMVVHALRQRIGERASDALVAFIAVTVVGYLGYLAVPVIGPVYVFGEAFPYAPPDPSLLSAAKSLALPMPRNCMPSLHSGWALLVWWSARPLARRYRYTAALFLGTTLLATVALGFHYVVDLVAAFPLTMAVQAWSTNVREPRLRRLAMAVGAVLAVGWISLVTWGPMLGWWAPILWLLAGCIVAGSWHLERRVYALRCNEVPTSASPVSTLSWVDRSIGVLAWLTGAAAFVHWSIVSNTLAFTLGSSSSVRMQMMALGVGGIALGALLGSRFAPLLPNPLRSVAVTSVALTLCSWGWPLALPWAQSAYLDWATGTASASPMLVVFGLVVAAPLLVPTSLLAGATLALLAEQVAGSQAGAARVAGLVVSRFLLGAATAALAIGYVLMPSLYSQHLPGMIHAVVAVWAFLVARRIVDRWHIGDERVDAQGAGSESAIVSAQASGTLSIWSPREAAMQIVVAALGGVAVSALVYLAAMLLGDTVHSRAQVCFALLSAAALGVGVAERVASRSNFAPGGALVLFALWMLLGPLAWEQIPSYFASFRGYIDQYNMMALFAERELVRLCVAGFLLWPPILLVAAAGFFATLRSSEAQEEAPADVVVTRVVRPLVLGLPAALLGGLAGACVLIPCLGLWHVVAGTAGVGLVVAAIGCFGRGVPAPAAVLAVSMAVLAALAPPADFGALISSSGQSFSPNPTGERGDADQVNPVDADTGVRFHAATTGRDAALVFGLGTAGRASFLRSMGFARVVVVEPNPAVIQIARDKFGDLDPPVFDDPNVSVVVGDGRSMLLRDVAIYDLIDVQLADVADPDVSSLYTREFYEVASRHLGAGGVLQQRIDLQRLSVMGVASVLASAGRSFDRVAVFGVGSDAVLIACRTICADEVLTPKEWMNTPGDRDDRWFLSPQAATAMIASAAEELGVDANALGSTDPDMFFRYHVASSFVRAPNVEPESLSVLRHLSEGAARSPSGDEN